MTPAQAALAWLLSKDDVIVIPKTSSRARLKENLAALESKADAVAACRARSAFPAAGRPGSAGNALIGCAKQIDFSLC